SAVIGSAGAACVSSPGIVWPFVARLGRRADLRAIRLPTNARRSGDLEVALGLHGDAGDRDPGAGEFLDSLHAVKVRLERGVPQEASGPAESDVRGQWSRRLSCARVAWDEVDVGRLIARFVHDHLRNAGPGHEKARLVGGLDGHTSGAALDGTETHYKQQRP